MSELGLGWREGPGGWLERVFQIRARGSTVGSELRAGLTTFFTIAYALFVNPPIMVAAGMPPGDAAVATALSMAIGTLVMGLWANLPFVLVPGMGLALYFTYGVVIGMGVPWQQALAAVFLEGVLFLIISLTGLRTALLNAIPPNLKIALTVGIGLFIALVGMRSAGLVVADPGSMIKLGDLHQPALLLSLLGLVLIAALSSLRVKGALLLGIGAVTVAAWSTGIAPPPSEVFAWPSLPRETFLAFRWDQILNMSMVPVILAFLFVDIFDTAGTLLAVGRLGGFLNEKGELPNADKALASDAVGTMVGASLGTSAFVTAIESAAGVEEGGRTGLVAVVVAFFFLLSLLVAPVFASIPAIATAPVLVLVGTLMMAGVKDLEWKQPDEAVPAFLTIVVMPFTFSIANGISFGLIAYVLIKLASGKIRDIHPFLYFLAAALIGFYAFVKGF